MKLSVLSCLIGACFLGCEPMKAINLRSQTPEPTSTASDSSGSKATVETELLGQFVNVGNRNVVLIEGVGLVTGLPGTGGDPPVSYWRTRLLDDMRRRGVENPNQILQSRSTALVVVRAYLPYLVKKGDRFDVEVYVPGDTDIQSLNGGYLLEVLLAEKAMIPGEGLKEGHVMAKAEGPIMVGTISDENADEQRGILLRGRVLQGGLSLKERDLKLMLRTDYQNERMSSRIANRIGERFFDYERSGQRVPLATAKTSSLIDLKLHSIYKENDERYLQVIRNIALKESDIAERLRMQRLHEELHNPVTSELAAIRLEAIGRPAIETLKTGLKNPSLEVRFHSAQALAYLGESAGVSELATAAREEPAFRVFSLAALAVIDEAESYVQLRKLLEEKSAETRYGAFRALRSLDPYDPLVRGESTPAGFRLHVLDLPGDPMIHLTRRKMAEIVLFGSRHQFKLPVVCRAGKNVMISSREGDRVVTLTKIAPGEETVRREVPNDVAAVIREVTEMGASYPDVAQMLMQSYQQGNLVGRLELDALPRAGRVYQRNEDEFTATYQRKARVGRPATAPALFSDAVDKLATESSEAAEDEGDDPVAPVKSTASEGDGRSGVASFSDVRDEDPELESRTRSNPRTVSEESAEKPPSRWNQFLKTIYGF